MNLYRSFGNLMEAWVTEGPPDSDWLQRNEDAPPSLPSDVDTNVRSESVDSGVETASSDISFPTPTSSVLADMEACTPESQDTPTSQSPVLSLPALSSSSSSSPRLLPTRPQPNRPADLHHKVEQALLRSESVRDKGHVTVDEVLRRRPQSALLPKRHASDLVRRERYEGCSLKKSVSPSLLVRQMSEVQRRPQSAIYDRQAYETIPEVLMRGDKTALSPGLLYLEQVCQMLEEYATQQLHNNNTLHNNTIPQMEAVEEAQESQDEQAVGMCHTDADEKEAAFCQSFEEAQVSSVPQQRTERPYGHFRQRSASDTNLTSLHPRRIKLDHREQHLSSHDLLETAEDDQENQKCQKEGVNKTKHFWRFKFSSLRREDSTKSQQMQTFEKSSSRRQLSQLFKRRRKTGPL